jgi:hypothetical protein
LSHLAAVARENIEDLGSLSIGQAEILNFLPNLRRGTGFGMYAIAHGS